MADATSVARFFGNAFIAIGWLVLTLGGLCTLIFGGVIFFGSGVRTSLEDWTLPGGMLAFGGASIWIGRAIKGDHERRPDSNPDV